MARPHYKHKLLIPLRKRYFGMDISFDEFKKQVVRDFKHAHLGYEMRRAASRERDCHYITSKNDIAQVALAKYIGASDLHLSAGLDLTYSLAMGDIRPLSFFQRLYSSAYDTYASDYTGYMPIAVGSAIAERILERGTNAKPGSVIVCTVGGTFTADGDFLESVFRAAALQIPLAIVLWNNSGQYTNGNLIKQISGFAQQRKNTLALSIQAVKGGDYPALCRTFEKQIDFARTNRATSLTFVEGCAEETEPMSRWIAEKEICPENKLKEIEAACRQLVDTDQKQAYYQSLIGTAPIRQRRRKLSDITQIVEKAHPSALVPPPSPNSVNNAIGMAQRGLRPVVEAGTSAIAGSLLSTFDTLPIIVRCTDNQVGKLIYALPNTTICTPCDHRQANSLYKTLVAAGNQAIVSEASGNITSSFETLVPGQVHVETSGSAMTIVCYGASVEPTIDAAKLMASKGVNVEVIDICSLRPFDTDGVVAQSIAKTRRLLITDPDRCGGAAAHIVNCLCMSGATQKLAVAPSVLTPKGDNEVIEASDVCNASALLLKK